MLREEQAEKELKRFVVKDAPARRREALARVGGAAGALGAEILYYRAGASIYRNWRRQQEQSRKATIELDGLPPAERGQLFATLFPRLGPHHERAWLLQLRLPYQGGYEGRAFRAPGEPAASRESRWQRFDSLLSAIEDYDPDVEWVATWAAYLAHDDAGLSLLLAAAIDGGGAEGQRVFEILCASGRGDHPIAAMGAHVPRALLTASRPDGWEFVQRMLLAAQRQEGLRQSILECVDGAHPEAFRRMLRLIRDQNLTRFSATARAVNTWFGAEWEADQARQVNAVVERVAR